MRVVQSFASLILAGCLTTVGLSQESGSLSADARRGEQLFTSHGCVQCHSINGKGGATGPDLGKRIGRSYTPATLAAVMWNHAPTMWAAMERQKVELKPLTKQDAADLFAYFYSVRFFDRPADAARGRRVFEEKRCVDCHGVSAEKSGSGKPVTQWDSLGNPIELAAAMWAHSANMRQAFDAKDIGWPDLTGQDVSDLLVYVRNLPGTRGKATALAATKTNGQSLFSSKGCVGCHRSKLALTPRLQGRTMSDIAAAMWNHPRNKSADPANLNESEMISIVTYLWNEQVHGSAGNPAAGRNVFTSKGCGGCHSGAGGGAPDLTGQKGQFSPVAMVSALWEHGPQMLQKMEVKNAEWPRFTAAEMANLIAYLNAGK